MKCFNKTISAYLLLLVGAGCYASQHQTVEHTIYIQNKSKEPIYGSLYPTDAGGKVLNTSYGSIIHEIRPQACKKINFIVAKKKPVSCRLIFAKTQHKGTAKEISGKESVENKINKNENKYIISKKIKLKPESSIEYYGVFDASSARGDSQLNIKTISAVSNCFGEKEPLNFFGLGS